MGAHPFAHFAKGWESNHPRPASVESHRAFLLPELRKSKLCFLSRQIRLILNCSQHEAMQRFRTAPWPFQQTFQIPIQNLPKFVSSFLGSFPLKEGLLDTDLVLFEPKNTLQLMAAKSVPTQDHWKFTVKATGQQDIRALLEATLADWIDFLFVAVPESFAVYADHDEYTTFYSQTKSDLAV